MKKPSNILLLLLAFATIFTQCEKEPKMELVEIIDNAFLSALIELGLILMEMGRYVLLKLRW